MKRDERTIAPAAEALGGEKSTTRRYERRRGQHTRRGEDPVENFAMQLAQSYLEKHTDPEPAAERRVDEANERVVESALHKPGWFRRG